MSRKIIHFFQVENNLETIINALTSIEGLGSWWTKDVSGSTEIGGIIKFRFGDVFKPDMKVIQSNNSCIQWECIGGEKDWNGDKFTFLIQDKGKNVMVTFTQDYTNNVSDEVFGQFNFNWGYYLHSLKDYCEKGTGTPWV